MTRILIACALFLPFGLAACHSQGHEAEMVLCDSCGVEKGTEGCCDAEAERCGGCEKIKGSPGCCK